VDSEAVSYVPRIAMTASRQRVCPVTLGFYPFEKHAAVQTEEERVSWPYGPILANLLMSLKLPNSLETPSCMRRILHATRYPE
jgi:hypothetical protein